MTALGAQLVQPFDSEVGWLLVLVQEVVVVLNIPVSEEQESQRKDAEQASHNRDNGLGPLNIDVVGVLAQHISKRVQQGCVLDAGDGGLLPHTAQPSRIVRVVVIRQATPHRIFQGYRRQHATTVTQVRATVAELRGVVADNGDVGVGVGGHLTAVTGLVQAALLVVHFALRERRVLDVSAKVFALQDGV